MTLPSSIFDEALGGSAEAQAALDDSEGAFYAALRVLTYGNRKHGIRAWVHPQDTTWRLTEKLLRHLFRYFMSPTALDVESRFHHLDHMLADAVLVWEAERLRGGMGHPPSTSERLDAQAEQAPEAPAEE